jgi:cytochrome c-type biogenesis protein CcmH/NrfG
MRRPRPASNQALSLWLIFGAICAVAVVYVALRPNLQRSNPAIEGANESQRKIADGFRVALARDSTNVDAHIGLADILFDTANWPQAIEHYRAAIRRDSSRVQAIVDLGVSYYNTGDRRQAERLFHLALVRDPHQPVALFNLGIVSEGNMDYAGAMSYFHRALQSSPPDGMKQSILAAMERVQQAGGKTAPPFQGAR